MNLPHGFDPTGIPPAVLGAVARVHSAHPEHFASVVEDGWGTVSRRQVPEPAPPVRRLWRTPAQEIRQDPRWGPYRAEVRGMAQRPGGTIQVAPTPSRDEQRRLRHRLMSGLTAMPTIGFEWFAARLLARLSPPDAAIELARNGDWLAEHGSAAASERYADLLRTYAVDRFGADPDLPGRTVDRVVRVLEGRR